MITNNQKVMLLRKVILRKEMMKKEGERLILNWRKPWKCFIQVMKEGNNLGA
jgi:hypothetical protein